MAEHDNPAQRDTTALFDAIRAALAGIPEVHRKAALKHATEMVWAELIDQSEQGKAAARQAPSEPGAKAAAATAAMQEAERAAAGHKTGGTPAA